MRLQKVSDDTVPPTYHLRVYPGKADQLLVVSTVERLISIRQCLRLEMVKGGPNVHLLVGVSSMWVSSRALRELVELRTERGVTDPQCVRQHVGAVSDMVCASVHGTPDVRLLGGVRPPERG